MPAKKATKKTSAPTAKQVAATQHKPLTLTLTIEDPAAIVQSGLMVLKRGDTGVMKRVSFSSFEQLAELIRTATFDLMETERDPAAAARRAANVQPVAPAKPASETPAKDDIPDLKMSVAARLADRLMRRADAQS